jgi:dienelactone hydrolase
VIFFMDGLGIRPVLWEMGQRLADAGYAVLLPDAYTGSAPILRWTPPPFSPTRTSAPN